MARSPSAILDEAAPKKRKVSPEWELTGGDERRAGEHVRARTAGDAALAFIDLLGYTLRKVEDENRGSG